MIRNVDCRVGLKQIPSNSIGLVLTDPPYFLHGMDDKWDSKRLKSRTVDRSSQTSCISGMPSSQRFDPEQGKRLQEFLLPCFVQCFRVLMPGSVLISFADPRLYHHMAMAAELAGFEIRGQGIWEHEGGQGKAASQIHIVERMRVSKKRKNEIIKSLDGRQTLQLRPKHEPFVIAQKPCEGRIIDTFIKYQSGLFKINCPTGGQRSTVFQCKKEKSRHKLDHLTIKPLPLIKELISTFAPPRGIILDPFLGSGTTGQAAYELGYDFVGFELDLHHFQTSTYRLSQLNGSRHSWMPAKE